VWKKSVDRIDSQSYDLFRRLCRYFLNVDPARRADHEHRPLRSTIHDDAHVALAHDVRGGHDQHPVNGESLDRHAEDL
jgi:hypothetical protein